MGAKGTLQKPWPVALALVCVNPAVRLLGEFHECKPSAQRLVPSTPVKHQCPLTGSCQDYVTSQLQSQSPWYKGKGQAESPLPEMFYPPGPTWSYPTDGDQVSHTQPEQVIELLFPELLPPTSLLSVTKKHETRTDSPGASGKQPRDPCPPWRRTLCPGHKPG